MQQMLQQLLANHEKAEASMSASMKSNQDLLTRLETDPEEKKAERKADQEDLKRMMEEMDANQMNADDKQEEMPARMLEDIKSSRVEMRSILCTFRSELKETIHRQMREALLCVQSEFDETTTSREATETEPDPGMMQSKEEHQKIPKGEAAVMPVGGPRKRRRVQNLVAERRQKRKERTRGNRRSRRKSAAACRKVSRHAKVAWRKRNLFRTGTQENCGSRKRVTVTDRKLIRYTGVVWLKEKVQTHFEGRKGLEDLGSRRPRYFKNRGLKQKVQGSKRIKDLGGGLPLCPRNERTSSWTYRKTIDSLKIAKQKAASYAASRQIKDWALWRGRHPPKRKKNCT
jgi:hypothetical protein